MATEPMWNSIRNAFSLCPFSILKYNSQSKTVSWDNLRLVRLFYSYITIGSTNILLLTSYIVYKILHTELSPPEKAIHYALFSIVVYVWPICLICIYTVIGNHGFYCYLFNVLSHFELSMRSKFDKPLHWVIRFGLVLLVELITYFDGSI